LVGEFVAIDGCLFAITDIRETAMRFLSTNQVVLEELPSSFSPESVASGVLTVPGSIIGVKVSPDGRFAALAWGPTFQFVDIRLIDLQSGKVCREIAGASWPIALTDKQICRCLSSSPPRVVVESIVAADKFAELELRGEFLDEITVSNLGHVLVCISFESQPKRKATPKTITVQDDNTGQSFQMPGIELPPASPQEARSRRFESFTYVRIFRMEGWSLVWEGVVGSHRVRRATLNEATGMLEIEWNTGEKNWITTESIPLDSLEGGAVTTQADPKFALSSLEPFTAIIDTRTNHVAAWWPALLSSTAASSQDGRIWVGAAKGSSFADSFRIEDTDEMLAEGKDR